MKILHITEEIGRETLGGGLSTVIDELYKNKIDGDNFLFCRISTSGENLASIPSDVKISSISNLILDIDEIAADKIFFHSLTLYNFYKQKRSVHNAWIVLHTNPIIESYFETISEQSQNFLNGLEDAKVIVVSQQEKDILISQGLSPLNIFVIYNGYSFNDDVIYTPKNNIEYGFIGRFNERKGFFSLLSSFKDIDRNLYLAGGFMDLDKPSHDRKIQKISMVTNNSNKFKFLGYCGVDRKKSFYNSIKALIVPSLYEPFGMIYLESIDNLTPVIVNKTKSAIEIFGENYPLYFSFEENSLVNAINILEEMSDLEIESLTLELKNSFVSKFSGQQCASQYRDLPLI